MLDLISQKTLYYDILYAKKCKAIFEMNSMFVFVVLL